MKLSIFKRIALSLLVMVMWLGTSLPMLKNVKNTYQILNDEYKHLSILHGAVLWETGVIRNMYDFGKTFPVFGQDKIGRTIIKKYDHLDYADQTIQLVHTLFYRIPGSRTDTDFNTIDQLRIQDPIKIAEQCAHIVAQIENIESVYKTVSIFLKKLSTDEAYKGFKSGIEKCLNEPWDKKSINTIIQRCEKYFNDKKDDHKKLLQLHYQIKAVMESFSKLINPFVKQHYGRTIIGSFNECNSNNARALYQPHMPQIILLTFVYKKCGHNRAALKKFYDVLHEQLERKLLKHSLSDNWVNSSFTAITPQESFKKLKSLFTSINNIDLESIEDIYEKFFYYLTKTKEFSPLSHKSVEYEYKKGETATFHDCTETLLRNIISLIFLNPKTGIFDKNYAYNLLAKNENTPFNLKVLDFFERFPSIDEAASPEAYNLWTHVIAEIPYASYKHTTEQSTALSRKGFVRLPSHISLEYKDVLISRGYTPLSDHEYGYELEPSIKNIIIALDYLLNLDLFEGELGEKLLDKNFIKRYFPLLCKKLNANVSSCFITSTPSAQQADTTDPDIDDFTKKSLFTTLALPNEIVCEINSYSLHTDLLLKKTSISSLSDQVKNFLQSISFDFSNPTLSFLITDKSNNNDVKKLMKMCSSFSSVFGLKLTNHNNFHIISESIGDLAGKKLPIAGSLHLLTLCIDWQPNAGLRPQCLLSLLEKFENKFIYLKQHPSLELLWNKALTLTQDINVALTFKARLYTYLIAQNRGIEQAFELAQDQRLAMYYRIKLYNELVAKNYGISQALELANDTSLDIEDRTDLYTALISKNHGINQALELAQDINLEVAYCIKLYIALIAKGQGITQALELAQDRSLEDQDRLTLFKELIEKDYGTDEALEFANNPETDIDYSIELYATLLPRGKGADDALALADDSNISEVYRIQIFKELLKNKFSDALASAKELLTQLQNNDFSEKETNELAAAINEFEGEQAMINNFQKLTITRATTTTTTTSTTQEG